MEKLQLLCFEICKRCNLSDVHNWCPSGKPRFEDRSTTPNIKQMVNFLDECIMSGFTGKVAYHYYNEPTLDLKRCRELSQGVKERGLKSVLWTNGTYDGKENLYDIFDEIYITEYKETNCDSCEKVIPYQPDDRLKVYDIQQNFDTKPCYRPEVIELIVDYHGFIHICCADWKNEIKIGNICLDDHEDIIEKWNKVRDQIKANVLPDVCKRCQRLEKSPALYYEAFEI